MLLWPTCTFDRRTFMIISYKTPGERSGFRSPSIPFNPPSRFTSYNVQTCPLGSSAGEPPGRMVGEWEWGSFGHALRMACANIFLLRRAEFWVGYHNCHSRNKCRKQTRAEPFVTWTCHASRVALVVSLLGEDDAHRITRPE